MRVALPFVVPISSLVAVFILPGYAGALTVALVASTLTLALAAPAMLSSQKKATASSRATPTTGPYMIWLVGGAVEVGLVLWTFTSLAMLVIVPEEAASWSIHLGASMLLVMVWTPLILFLKPDDRGKQSGQEESTTPEQEEAEDFVPEQQQRIRRPHRTEGREYAEADNGTRSLWSFGEATGDGEPSSGRAPDRVASEPSVPSDRNRNTSTDVDEAESWAQWPDENTESQPEGRTLWSFPRSEDDNFEQSHDAPDPEREAEVAAEVARTEWEETAQNDEPMAWDILETILEEDEAQEPESESSWEPDEWPDFNYNV